MPYFYKASDPSFIIYEGISAEENDWLAEYGWPEDILFHAETVSSSHIYLRTKTSVNKDDFRKIKDWKDFETYLNVPEIVIKECLQLCKYNSIKGSKMDLCKVFITPWINVSKKGIKEEGTINVKPKYKLIFNVKEKKKLRKQIEKTKEKIIITKNEMKSEKKKRDEMERKKNKNENMKYKEIKKKKYLEQKEKEKNDYKNVIDKSNMVSNKDIGMTAEEYEDNFM